MVISAPEGVEVKLHFTFALRTPCAEAGGGTGAGADEFCVGAAASGAGAEDGEFCGGAAADGAGAGGGKLCGGATAAAAAVGLAFPPAFTNVYN